MRPAAAWIMIVIGGVSFGVFAWSNREGGLPFRLDSPLGPLGEWAYVVQLVLMGLGIVMIGLGATLLESRVKAIRGESARGMEVVVKLGDSNGSRRGIDTRSDSSPQEPGTLRSVRDRDDQRRSMPDRES